MWSVYPRWRGEHGVNAADIIRQAGLSPLARGTQDKEALGEILRRFIPAGAGNTLVRAC